MKRNSEEEGGILDWDNETDLVVFFSKREFSF